MARPVIILRPETGASATAQRLDAMGLEGKKLPLFDIKPIDWVLPDNIDSLLLGSANAVRNIDPYCTILKNMPVYTVGKSTADSAAQAGLDVRFAGSSNLEEAVDRLLADGWTRPLRLCGEQHYILRNRHAADIKTVINYAARARQLSYEDLAIIAAPAVILAHSARAVRHLEALLQQHDVNVNTHILLTISARAAAEARLSWGQTVSAKAPSDRAMLELAEKLCK